MSFFTTMNIAASGLTAQRARMDTIAENIANVNTTRTADGGPYRRRITLFEEISDLNPFQAVLSGVLGPAGTAHQGRGVRVSRVVESNIPGMLAYDPSHPDANEDGYVQMPNVNIVEEMVNMIAATRSYEANITAMSNVRILTQRTLEIGQGR